jgi:hypothetical protein
MLSRCSYPSGAVELPDRAASLSIEGQAMQVVRETFDRIGLSLELFSKSSST